MQHTLDQGMTLLDTAYIYGPFTSEEIVGKAIKGRREQVVLATKGGLVVTDPTTRAMRNDGSPSHLKAACEASLRRLWLRHSEDQARKTFPVAFQKISGRLCSRGLQTVSPTAK